VGEGETLAYPRAGRRRDPPQARAHHRNEEQHFISMRWSSSFALKTSAVVGGTEGSNPSRSATQSPIQSILRSDARNSRVRGRSLSNLATPENASRRQDARGSAISLSSHISRCHGAGNPRVTRAPFLCSWTNGPRRQSLNADERSY
jgi:hypothetical protein